MAAQQAAAAAEAFRTREGSEAQGYKPTTVTNFGPFGQKPILDVPYSVNVLSADLLANRIATPDEIFKISPVVQPLTPASRGWPVIYLRGFPSTSHSEDGLRSTFTGNPAIEDKERIEIITGMTGFLYGGSDVGGLVNYVYKKPTPVPYASITGGSYGNMSGFAHLDLGGPIDKDGKFAYRLNIVGQDGKVPTDPAKQTRTLITGVFDWNITPDTKFEVLASHHDKVQNIGSNWIADFATVPFDFKTVPDPAKYWGQLYSKDHTINDRVQTSITSDLNDIFTFRAAYAHVVFREKSFYSLANYWDDNGPQPQHYYEQGSWKLPDSRYVTNTAYGFLDAKFATGPILHKLTIGSYGNQTAFYNGAGSSTYDYQFYDLSQGPIYTAPPDLVFDSNFNSQFKQNTYSQRNYVIGDDIKFNEYWSALVGVNYATISNSNFSNVSPFSTTSAVSQSKLSPTLSLIYKPVSQISTYVTYSESLQAGAVVPNLPFYTNRGTILDPYVGEQYEVGAKADVGDVLWTAALFQIDKANQFARSNPDGTLTYVSDGRQVHKGIELTATGNLAPGLRIFGGVTIMDAMVVKTANPATDNKQPINIANNSAKVSLEYDLPFLTGLTLTGGVYYTGDRAANVLNSVFLDPYVTEDLGLRYRTVLTTGQEAVYRFNVSNITNKAYWLTPNYVGAPRTFAFSAQIKF